MTIATQSVDSRFDTALHLAQIDHDRLDQEVRDRAKHLADHARKAARSGRSTGGVRAYGSEGAELDELITQRSAAWDRLQTLRWVQTGERS